MTLFFTHVMEGNFCCIDDIVRFIFPTDGKMAKLFNDHDISSKEDLYGRLDRNQNLRYRLSLV